MNFATRIGVKIYCKKYDLEKFKSIEFYEKKLNKLLLLPSLTSS